MNRAAIEPRPTLDELFGPEPEALIATLDAIGAEIDATRAEADAIRAEVEAAKAEAEGSPLLIEIRAAIAEEGGRPGEAEDDLALMAVADTHPGLLERYTELVEENVGRVRRYQELLTLLEERLRERALCRGHRFFLGPIELYPADTPAYAKLDETSTGRLVSHYQHWLAALWCAAEDAAFLGMRTARAALEAMGCTAERAARRCREAIDAARAALARVGRMPASRAEPVRTVRELIGELLAPAVLAAGGDLGAFVMRC